MSGRLFKVKKHLPENLPPRRFGESRGVEPHLTGSVKGDTPSIHLLFVGITGIYSSNFSTSLNEETRRPSHSSGLIR